MERKTQVRSQPHARSKAKQSRRSGVHGQRDVACRHFPHCIGCPLVALPYETQLERKRQKVIGALAAYPALAALAVPPVVDSPKRFGYRARVKLVVRRNRGEIAIGLYVPGSHRVMDIDSCAVHPGPVNQVVRYLKQKVLESNITPYDERDDSGELRYVDLRFSFARNEVCVVLVTRHPTFPAGGQLARSLMRKFSFVTGVLQNINEQRGNVIWGERYIALAGRDTLLERVGGLQLVYPPGVFAQANPLAARKIYQQVREWAALSGRETLLDLYCGVGPISLTLAGGASIVYGFDDSELAINAAKQNARRNGVSNCRFAAGDAAEKLTEFKFQRIAVDMAVLNPPRKGLQRAAMEALLALAVPRLIYVSCEPGTLARDLSHLVAAGYRVTELRSFDMFPQTAQVETVVILERLS